MTIGVMQPYFFPYLGYFQLIKATDKFIFYDDVNFIKGGWINRNKIIFQNKSQLITINLQSPSPNKKINEILVGNRHDKVMKTIRQAYSRAKYFKDVFPMIEDVFSTINKGTSISQLAIQSVINTAKYLKINTDFELSSGNYPDTVNLGKEVRLIEICERNNAISYVNAQGGKSLYSKSSFMERKINLQFISPKFIEYQQGCEEFIPGLSVIDVMMQNSPDQISIMLDNYELE
jgi:hypothetical protein